VLFLGRYGVGAAPETAADDAAFEGITADIASLADGVGIITGPAVIAVIIIPVRPECKVPQEGTDARMVSTGIRSRAVTPHIGPVAVLPLVVGMVTAGQGGGDQYEPYMFRFFHGLLSIFVVFYFQRLLFHRYEDLIILWYFNIPGIAIGVLRHRVLYAQRGNGILVDNSLEFVKIDPYFMRGQYDIMRAVGVLDTHGCLDGARAVDRIGHILFFVSTGGNAGQTGDHPDQNGNGPPLYCYLHIDLLSCKDKRMTGM